MGLYAIGDLHLSLSTDKPMDVFGKEWKNHVEKIEKNWVRQIRQEDTVVITGDHSWGRNLNESRADLGSLPPFRAGRSFCAETMTCSGTLKRPVC